jgi:hypothetical protein
MPARPICFTVKSLGATEQFVCPYRSFYRLPDLQSAFARTHKTPTRRRFGPWRYRPPTTLEHGRSLLGTGMKMQAFNCSETHPSRHRCARVLVIDAPELRRRHRVQLEHIGRLFNADRIARHRPLCYAESPEVRDEIN